MKTVAFFDFDGTVTKEDSLIQFIRFSVGNLKMLKGLIALSPLLIAFKLKIIPNYIAKEKMLTHFFKGMNEDTFKRIAKNYSLKMIDSIVRPKAMEKILWYQKQGHTVVIVSASVECWLKPWCQLNNIHLIATKMEFIDHVFTGKMLTKNCYGKEKVDRITECYNLNVYDQIDVYGDSSGDKELLSIADNAYYKPFRTKGIRARL